MKKPSVLMSTAALGAGALLATIVISTLLRIALAPDLPVTIHTALAGFVGISVPLLAYWLCNRREARFAHSAGASIDQLMVGTAESAFFMDSIKTKIEKEKEQAGAISQSANHLVDATKELTDSATRAAQMATDVRQESQVGVDAVNNGLKNIVTAQQDAHFATERMAQLQKNAQRIHGVTDLIADVAARTNLLAINAAIEAARSGVQGKGFAVIAAEVRHLAHRTKEATEDISKMVSDVTSEISLASSGLQQLTSRIAELSGTTTAIHETFGKITRYANLSDESIRKIASACQEQVHETQKIASNTEIIVASMQVNVNDLPTMRQAVEQLSDLAEQLHFAYAMFGAPTPHDQIRAAALTAAADIGKLFKAAIIAGEIRQEALFSHEYEPIPDTNPTKYTTAFDSFTDRVLPAIQEAILAKSSSAIYAGAVDLNGYFPTHNLKFSKPLTGHYATDLANNRTKRKFTDRTGQRCGSNQCVFLLQTYKRDTGEVMHDLSVPIHVDGKHWGGFRIGYSATTSSAYPG